MTAPKATVNLAILVICAAVVLFEFTLNGSFIGSDDAYIHLRYIQNLRTGNGFGFNPDRPSNGSTSPLWVVFAAATTYLLRNIDLLMAVKALNTLLFVASIWVFYLFLSRLTSSPWGAVLATLVYASDPWLLKWSGSAMETGLVSLLTLWGTYLLLHPYRHKTLIWASLLLGLATLARPECALLFCFLVFPAIGIGSRGWTSRGATALSMYLLPLLPWAFFTIPAFGSPLPNTFFAKMAASQATVQDVGWYFIRVIGLSYWPWLLVLSVQIVRFLIKKPRPATLRTEDFTVILLGVWDFVLLAFYTLGKLQTPSTRYLQLAIPFLLTAGYRSLASLCKVLPHRLAHYLVLLFVGLVIIYNALLNAFLVLPSSHDFSEGVLSTYRAVGEFLRTNTSEKDRVAIAIDVGAIGFYSEREIIDLGGLNSPEVIPYLPDGLGYVFVSKPDYLVITGENSPYHLLQQARFRNVALPVALFRADVGMRAKVGGTSGEENYYVSVYRLSWP